MSKEYIAFGVEELRIAILVFLVYPYLQLALILILFAVLAQHLQRLHPLVFHLQILQVAPDEVLRKTCVFHLWVLQLLLAYNGVSANEQLKLATAAEKIFQFRQKEMRPRDVPISRGYQYFVASVVTNKVTDDVYHHQSLGRVVQQGVFYFHYGGVPSIACDYEW